MRVFRYVGDPVLTRGDYGVNVSGGHTREDDPDMVYVWDPDFGDMPWVSVDRAAEEGFVEFEEEE